MTDKAVTILGLLCSTYGRQWLDQTSDGSLGRHEENFGGKQGYC